MKVTILSTDSMFGADEDKDLVKDVWLFVERGDSYQELDDEAPLGSKLSDNDVVYFIEDRFFPEADMIPLKSGREEKLGSVGCSVGDTVLSVKLQVQNLYGIPVTRVRVREAITGEVKNTKTICNGQCSCYVYKCPGYIYLQKAPVVVACRLTDPGFL